MSHQNELIPQRPWLQRHWKWLVPLSIFILLGTLIIFMVSDIIKGMGTAIADPNLVPKATEKAASDPDVQIYFGTNLAAGTVLEGDVLIHENGKTIRVTVPLKGDKGSGMMDIYAHHTDEKWEHDSIDVRLKKPKKHIIRLPRE